MPARAGSAPSPSRKRFTVGVRVPRSSDSAWRSVFHWLRLSAFGGVGFMCEARAWLADIRS